MAAFEILFGFNPRFAKESSCAISGEKVLVNARRFELAMALINRAERLAQRALENDVRYQIVDIVLVRPGKHLEGSKFQARMCLEPFKVI